MLSDHPAPRRRRLPELLGAALLLVVCMLALLTVVVPFALGAQSYTVLTGSMRPALEPGTLIAVRAAEAADIRVGDVITYQLRSGEPAVATHRVVGVGVSGDGERLFTTRGDANDTPDREPVRAVQIRGVLVYAVPWLGYVNLWATPAVKSALITALGAGAILWGVVALIGDARRRRRGRGARGGRSAAATSATVLLAAAALPLGAPPAHASQTDDHLQVSVDGESWSPDTTLTLFDRGRHLVPGDATHARFWVRSSAPDAGILEIDAQWQPSDPEDPQDRALSAALSARATEALRLAPGESRAVDIDVALPGAADEQTRRGSSDLVVTLDLRQAAPAAPLPPTGAAPPIPLLIGAGALSAAGGTLLLLARRRRRREAP